MSNLDLYEAIRNVPKEAQKTILGGRLKGMTDINPMWRIKTLTEQFGVCGVGWKYEIVNKWIETTMAKDEIAANVEINLYVKIGDKWSEPIPGIGGSMLVAREKNGLYVDDECYKKALTDAISVACKALGMGADVYWQNDRTKYTKPEQTDVKAEQKGAKPEQMDTPMRDKVFNYCKEHKLTFSDLAKDYNVANWRETSESRWAEIWEELCKR